MIKQDSIEHLKSVVDIVDLVSNYVVLKKAGANFIGLCPFHQEKTPSFTVNTQKQFFHCFGCGTGGDAISFIMNHLGLSYPDAIEKIAQDYNISLEYEKSAPKPNSSLETINKLYKKILQQNKNVLDYLVQRGLSSASVEEFELGFAPSSNAQIDFLKSQQISIVDAIDTGIFYSTNDGKIFSRFQNRLTFPIYSPYDRIVGFGGRIMHGSGAKYVNSPQTSFFNKSQLLYGYSKARSSIQSQKSIIVTEGYLDVIMLHQAGFNTAVATLGTALGKAHLPLLKKSSPKIIIAYDGDDAGQKAALSATKLLYQNEFEGSVAIFDKDKDPADMVKLLQINEIRSKFVHAKTFSSFIAISFAKDYKSSSVKERQNIINETKKYLSSLAFAFKDDLQKECAKSFGVDGDVFRSRAIFEPIARKQKGDILELETLKTLATDARLARRIIKQNSVKIFMHHKDILQAIISDEDSAPLRALSLNDEIEVLSEEHLQKNIKTLRIRFLEKQIQAIKTSNDIDFTQKSQTIRDLQKEILNIKQG